jgi:choline kinase
MRALILAAGRGSRLGLLGADRPKCLVELDGAPLLERQAAALRGGGIQQIGIVRGYRADMLALPGLVLFENARWESTNMVRSLMTASEWLRAVPTVVSYADIFYRAELIRRLVNAPGDLVITYDRAWRKLWSRRFADPLTDAETFRMDDEECLLDIGGRANRIEEIEGQYMGLLKFTPAAWAAVETLISELDETACDRLDMTGLLRRLLLAQALRIRTIGTEGQWGEIDSASDVALYRSMLESGELELEESSPQAPRIVGR